MAAFKKPGRTTRDRKPAAKKAQQNSAQQPLR
jgi:hypothetical protein